MQCVKISMCISPALYLSSMCIYTIGSQYTNANAKYIALDQNVHQFFSKISFNHIVACAVSRRISLRRLKRLYQVIGSLSSQLIAKVVLVREGLHKSGTEKMVM